MKKNDEDELDKILLIHLNEIKAGHDDKIKQAVLALLASQDRASRVDELEDLLHPKGVGVVNHAQFGILVVANAGQRLKTLRDETK